MNLQQTEKKVPEDLTEYLHFYHTNQKNYLVVQFEPEEAYFETGMILNNSLRGLLPVSVRPQKDCYELLYDISNMQSLDAIHQNRQYHFSELADYFRELKNLLMLLDDYLLNADDLVLREEYLFASYDGTRYGFLYLPGYGISFQRQMKDLNDQVMRRLDHLDEKATRLVYELDRLFCLENWNFEELERILLPLCESLSEGKKDSASDFAALSSLDRSQTISETSRSVSEKSQTESERGTEKEKSWWQRLTGHKKMEKAAECSLIREAAEEYAAVKDVIVKGDEEKRNVVKSGAEDERTFETEDTENTGILKEESFVVPCLLPLDGNRTRIPISKEQVIIGSLRDRTDFYLEDSHVSRMHLRIFQENDRWYIMDQNSTNGTFLEEERLLPYEKYELANYSRIRIADREYTFRMDS